MKHAISWFEIPTDNFDRALNFYNAILGIKMETQDFGSLKMAFFPSDKGGVGGALVHHREFYKPSGNGVLVYLNADPDLNNVLSKAEKAGGKVVIKKRMITQEIGYMAVFVDTEGNKVALHSMK